MKLKAIFVSLVFMMCWSANAVIVWTGVVDSDLTNDANWDFSRSSLTTIRGIVGKGNLAAPTLNDDLLFTGKPPHAPMLGNISGRIQASWGVAAGHTITFDGVSMTNPAPGNDGLGVGDIHITNGSRVTAFFIRAKVFVDSTSGLKLEGEGNPMPPAQGALPSAIVYLAAGAEFELASVGEYTEGGRDRRIFVDGVSLAEDRSLLSLSGSSPKGIPEPGFYGLLVGGFSLGCVWFLRRQG